jgi:hypothetical protein
VPNIVIAKEPVVLPLLIAGNGKKRDEKDLLNLALQAKNRQGTNIRAGTDRKITTLPSLFNLVRRLSQVSNDSRTLNHGKAEAQTPKTGPGLVLLMAFLCLVAVVSLRMAVVSVVSAANRSKAEIIDECDLKCQVTAPKEATTEGESSC